MTMAESILKFYSCFRHFNYIQIKNSINISNNNKFTIISRDESSLKKKKSFKTSLKSLGSGFLFKMDKVTVRLSFDLLMKSLC